MAKRFKIVASGAYADGSPVTHVVNGTAYPLIMAAGASVKTCRAHVAYLNAAYPGTSWKGRRETR